MKQFVITLILTASFATEIIPFNETNSGEILERDQPQDLISIIPFNKASSKHAALMMLSWSYLSIIQVFLNRFMKHYWRWHYFVHSCVGMCMFLLTAISFYIIFKSRGYEFLIETHTVFGGITLVAITFLFLTGSLAIISRKQIPEVW